MPMNWKEIVATARLAACRCERYFTTAIMALIPHEAPGLGTVAVTKDWVMMVDPAAVERWGVEETTTAIRHEVRHCLRDHHGRGLLLGDDSPENQFLKNVAADAEINDGAEFANAKWPGEPVLPSTLPGGPMPDGLLFEEYYDALRKQAEQQQKRGGKQGKGNPKPGEKGGGSGKGDGKGTQKSNQPGEDGKGGEPGDGGGGSPQPSNEQGRLGAGWCGSCAGHAAPNEPSAEGSKGDGEKGEGEGAHGPVEGRSEVEKRRIVKQVAEAIQQESARGRGTVPGSWARWADTQLKPPKIPWQQKLAKVMRATVAYRAGAVDRRYAHSSRRQAGIGYGVGKPRLPGLRAPVPQVAVVIDTSGSMGDGEIQAAVNETAGVLKAVGSDIEFCACDAAVHALAPIRNPRDISKLVKGGGGTDFRPPFIALDKRKHRPEIVVFVTDGCGPAPAQQPDGMRTIWVLVGKHRTRPSFEGGKGWGEFIEVDS